METYAIVEGGVVTNIVLWDGSDDWAPPAGSTAVDLPDGSPVSIGYVYDGHTFTPPAGGN